MGLQCRFVVVAPHLYKDLYVHIVRFRIQYTISRDLASVAIHTNPKYANLLTDLNNSDTSQVTSVVFTYLSLIKEKFIDYDSRCSGRIYIKYLKKDRLYCAIILAVMVITDIEIILCVTM